MDRVSATKTINTGSILGRVKSKIRIHSFPAWRSAIKRDIVVVLSPLSWVVDAWEGDSLLEDRKFSSLSPDQENLVNKNIIIQSK